ncbi:MAG: hypothetical protein HY516_01135 [Candidatus Aenigmarchaeota archaeon]|nr:hypothetical protein [Candidatus Aenigmarchaeota archaeon]
MIQLLSKTEDMKRMIVQPARSGHYHRTGHEIAYSPTLMATGKNYHDSRLLISQGQRMSTAAEELAIQLGLERAGKDPRKAEEFSGFFRKHRAREYIRQMTLTALRVPKGRNPWKKQTDSKGRNYYAREVLIGGEVVGEFLVPEGVGHVVKEWDEVFGLPSATEYIGFPHDPYTTHFRFNPSPVRDERSGYQDAIVLRSANGPLSGDTGCLDIDAGLERSFTNSGNSVRLVSGPLPEINNRHR